MPKLDVLNLEGKNLHTVELNEAVFGIEPNTQAMFDAINLARAGARQGTHKVKTRGEVRGGGRKPWRQKGTGRARAGSTRSPIWVGGGVVFGPTPRSYTFKMNRKVRTLAIISALSQKVADNEMIVVENLTVDSVKTKEFKNVLNNLNIERKVLFVVDEEEDVNNAFLSMRNIPGTQLLDVKGLNVYDLVNADRVVFTEKAVATAGEVFA